MLLSPPPVLYLRKAVWLISVAFLTKRSSLLGRALGNDWYGKDGRLYGIV